CEGGRNHAAGRTCHLRVPARRAAMETAGSVLLTVIGGRHSGVNPQPPTGSDRLYTSLRTNQRLDLHRVLCLSHLSGSLRRIRGPASVSPVPGSPGAIRNVDVLCTSGADAAATATAG